MVRPAGLLATGMIALLATSTGAAQTAAQYPTRPIRAVVPFPGGGGPMNIAGRVVQTMNTALG